MNTTHFVMMNNMNTMNMINHMNMIHMTYHNNTTETVSNVVFTGWDVMIIIVGSILLIWGGVKVTDWMLDKTYPMKEPWGSIMFIIGMFSYVIVGVVVISMLVSLV